MTQRLIVQMGMGTGTSLEEAAARAIADAQGRAVIHAEARFATRVSLGMPVVMDVDPSDLARAFGTPGVELGVELHVVKGGMELPQPDGSALYVISAAIELFPQPDDPATPAQEA